MFNLIELDTAEYENNIELNFKLRQIYNENYKSTNDSYNHSSYCEDCDCIECDDGNDCDCIW